MNDVNGFKQGELSETLDVASCAVNPNDVIL